MAVGYAETLTLAPEPDEASFEGVVEDADGKPAAGANVTLLNGDRVEPVVLQRRQHSLLGIVDVGRRGDRREIDDRLRSSPLVEQRAFIDGEGSQRQRDRRAQRRHDGEVATLVGDQPAA